MKPGESRNFFVLPATALPPRMGRDPHDTVTMELPGMDAPTPHDIVTRIAEGLYEEVDDEVPWMVLLLKELSDDEQAEAGDFRFKGRLL